MTSKRIKKKLIREYIAGGRSYRELEAVYGFPASTLHRWVVGSGMVRESGDGESVGADRTSGERIASAEEPRGGTTGDGRKAIGLVKRRMSISGLRSNGSVSSSGETSGQETAAEEIRRLRRELDEARLYGRLMEAMIEIAEEEFEIPIRKKSGAKR